MGTKIGFKIGGRFRYIDKNKTVIGFDVMFPSIYEEECEVNKDVSVCIEKLNNGEVFLQLYEGDMGVRAIRWYEWWQYKCYRLKESERENYMLSLNYDFEPCNERFESLFKSFIDDKDSDKIQLYCYDLWIVPIFYESLNEMYNEENFSSFSKMETELKGKVSFCEQTILIDDLANVFKFNSQQYYEGKRFKALQFEKDVLSAGNAELILSPFVRFLRFPDGKYYKRVISENGFVTGYVVKYAKFDFGFDEQSENKKE